MKATRIITFLFSTVLSLQLIAQTPANVQQVIDAELGFAKLSRDKNTRIAFLENLAPDAVIVSRGEIINGIEQWKTSPADSSLLNWWPVYADVSIDGDLGYTTGPFEYFKDQNDQTPVGLGYYSTVWKKQKDGVWKVGIDLGISLRESDSIGTDVQLPKIKRDRSQVSKAKAELKDVEDQYTKKLNSASISFLADYLAEEFRVHRPNNAPATKKDQLESLGENTRKFAFEQVYSDMSSSGDLAYSYGKVKIEITRDNAPRTIPANYMRVWKRINNKWQIVLDVISLG